MARGKRKTPRTIDCLGKPLIKVLVQILDKSLAMGATLITIVPEEGSYLVQRYAGNARLLADEYYSPCQFRPLVSRLKILAGMKISEKNLSQNGTFAGVERWSGLRAVTLPTKYGEAVFISII